VKHLRARRRSVDAPVRPYGEAALGVAWALSIVAFGWAGLALDGWLGTTPLLGIGGAVLGIAGGAASLWARAAQPRRPQSMRPAQQAESSSRDRQDGEAAP